MTFNPVCSLGVLALIIAASGCCGTAMNSCGCGSSCGLRSAMPMQLVDRTAGKLINPCGDGCGEVYYDERINHPPVCDPCGGSGDCGSCQRPILSVLRRAWGLPYVGACECATSDCNGCSSCNGGDNVSEYSSSMPNSDCPSCMAAQQSMQRIEQHTTAPTHVHAVPSQQAHSPTPAARKPVSSQSHDAVDSHGDSDHGVDAHGADAHGHGDTQSHGDGHHEVDTHNHAEPAPAHDDHHASQAPRRIRSVSAQRMIR